MKFEMPSFLKKQDSTTTPEASNKEVGPELKQELQKTVSLIGKAKDYFSSLSPDTIVAGGITAAAFLVAIAKYNIGDVYNSTLDPSEIAGITTGIAGLYTYFSNNFHKFNVETPNKEVLE